MLTFRHDLGNEQFVLPILIDNIKLFETNKLKEVSSINLIFNTLIILKYSNVNNNYLEYFSKKEKNYYSSYYDNKNVTIIYSIPKNKECVCNVLIKCGYRALTSDLVERYLL